MSHTISVIVRFLSLILCHKQMCGLVTISFYNVFVFNHFGFYSKVKLSKRKIKTAPEVAAADMLACSLDPWGQGELTEMGS